jgi:hypothetical protein
MNSKELKRQKNKKFSRKSNKASSDENQYYLDIAKKYKSSKHIITIVFVVYLLLMIIMYRDQITMENFRYLIKYLDTSSPEYTGQTRTIHYDPAAELKLDIYKGDLAVVRSKSVDLYNMIGNVMVNYTINYPQPVMLTSKRNMLVYSQGDYSYTLSNSFSQLHSETLKYPISGAAVSDSGVYAIVSKTIEYRSAVYVYDKNYNLISQILKDKIIMDVQINSSGNEVLTIASYNSDGEFHTEIMTASPYSEKENSVEIQSSTYGIKAKYNSIGGYVVVCDNQLLFYNESHTLVNTFPYKGNIPLNYYLGDDFTTIVFNENIVGNNNSIYIFDKHGTLIFNDVITGQISDITGNSEYIYILFNDEIVRINAAKNEINQKELEHAGSMRVLLKDADKLIICYSQNAYIYVIEELFESGGIDELYN